MRRNFTNFPSLPEVPSQGMADDRCMTLDNICEQLVSPKLVKQVSRKKFAVVSYPIVAISCLFRYRMCDVRTKNPIQLIFPEDCHNVHRHSQKCKTTFYPAMQAFSGSVQEPESWLVIAAMLDFQNLGELG